MGCVCAAGRLPRGDDTANSATPAAAIAMALQFMLCIFPSLSDVSMKVSQRPVLRKFS